MSDSTSRPIVGITAGDPVGVGPELICRALSDAALYRICRPLVIGEARVLAAAQSVLDAGQVLSEVSDPAAGAYEPGCIDIYPASACAEQDFRWGRPSAATGRAMLDCIEAGIDLALSGRIAALVTCPINKTAMKLAGSPFHGHTELLAHRTGAGRYAMMMAGSRLRIVLATIHVPLCEVPQLLSRENLLDTLRITDHALRERFGIPRPRIAVAGLNPHGGEADMFGTEESRIIAPAVRQAAEAGMNAEGPFPPDTLFHYAVDGPYDAVLCMYHDQGLIPFKLIHFSDGVNTTLGLPVIRTSVDHGTAYDIAGRGLADPGSLTAAIRMAAEHAVNRQAAISGPV